MWASRCSSNSYSNHLRLQGFDIGCELERKMNYRDLLVAFILQQQQPHLSSPTDYLLHIRWWWICGFGRVTTWSDFMVTECKFECYNQKANGERFSSGVDTP